MSGSRLRHSALTLAAMVVLGATPARAQYPYGYGYGYGPGYNVPVTPGFGAVYGGSTDGSYGFGQNRRVTTFGAATGVVPRVATDPKTRPSAGYVVPGGAVRFPTSPDRPVPVGRRTVGARQPR